MQGTVAMYASAGARIRRLRLSLGLGQADLADRAGVSGGFISMLENGRAEMDVAQSSALASVLDCTVDFLGRSSEELQATAPQLRAYADASQKTVDRVVADSVSAVEAAQTIGLQFIANRLPLFEDDLNDDAAIERFALEVRAHANLRSEMVVGNSIRTAERLGCMVLPLDSELGRHLGLSLRVGDTPVIRVSRSSTDPSLSIPGDRQRFTVAHELGHLVLHHDVPQPGSPSEAARREKQAHRFASAFLVPGDAALDDLHRFGGRVTLGTLAKLKEKYGFSIKAFVVRFRHLGVIDDDHARSLYKQISARRWNKEEPVPVGTEAAVWFDKAMTKARGHEGALEHAARMSGLGRRYFERWVDWTPRQDHTAEAALTALPVPATGSQAPLAATSARVTRLPVSKPLPLPEPDEYWDALEHL